MYDVIIIGAGPSGGQCARDLTRNGKKVLLAERHKAFSVNSYSSAGTPNELLEEFQIPDTVIGSRWHQIRITSSHNQSIHSGAKPRGAVMDFEKLRAFLAGAAGEYRLGFSYQKFTVKKKTVVVHFKDAFTGEECRLETKVLVDATGSERQVLGKNLQTRSAAFSATGIEYLVDVPPKIYQQWSGALSFFLGRRWMPQGYSWIFPMEPNRLKIGVGRYFQNETYVPHQNTYQHYLSGMMQECLGSQEYPLLDRHGKTLIYTYAQKDPHYDGPVIAIGDAVSSINPLGLEGIRHGMHSGRIAATHIIHYLNGMPYAFNKYERQMRAYRGIRWKICELIMKNLYQEPHDARIDAMVNVFNSFTFEELIELLFHYRPLKALKFFSLYGLSLAKFR